ncbi:hypothetical protein HDU85_001023 [Gaertneriomyces sp. JEL0708]|nr:hypothetical protein HDU85_001023 [Gaertneriomyces sp. JEL0708]
METRRLDNIYKQRLETSERKRSELEKRLTALEQYTLNDIYDRLKESPGDSETQLPFDDPPIEQQRNTAQKSLEGKILNILLVEDSKILQEIFRKWWQRKGHNVFVASNGQEAIEMFKGKTFSIIFLDIELPIKDGLTTAREIRAYEVEKGSKPVPIIGVSGYTQKQYKERALESGMSDFISKDQGYQFNDIYKIVLEYCG